MIGALFKIWKTFHENVISSRRMPAIAAHIRAIIPPGARILDVGAGDGFIDSLIVDGRSDISIVAVDVRPRDHTFVPVATFEGAVLPFDDQAFDVVMLIDVLHHAPDPRMLLREAARVGRTVIVKDHTKDGIMAGLRLAFMDYVGNRYANVALPNVYFTTGQWRRLFADLGLHEMHSIADLGLYPWPLSVVFERRLHFLCTLQGAPALVSTK